MSLGCKRPFPPSHKIKQNLARIIKSRGYSSAFYFAFGFTLVSAKAELTKDLDEKLKAANVKKSVVKLIQIDVSS